MSQFSWGQKEFWAPLGYRFDGNGLNRFIADSPRNASRTDCTKREDRPDPTRGLSDPQLHLCRRLAQDCHLLPQSDYIFDRPCRRRLVHTLLNDTRLVDKLQALFASVGGAAEVAKDFWHAPGPKAEVPSLPHQWQEAQETVDRTREEMRDGVRRQAHHRIYCELTEQARKLLDTFYAEDFARFGFWASSASDDERYDGYVGNATALITGYVGNH